MKAIVLVFATIAMPGCNSELEQYAVQGKWQIEQLTYECESKPDSIVNKNLCYIAFDECSEEENKKLNCTGNRTYAEGQSDNFNFRTRRNTYENESVKVIDMAYGGNQVTDELRGEYRITRLTEKELILVCTDCGVGKFPEMLTRFELRATKVPE